MQPKMRSESTSKLGDHRFVVKYNHRDSNVLVAMRARARGGVQSAVAIGHASIVNGGSSPLHVPQALKRLTSNSPVPGQPPILPEIISHHNRVTSLSELPAL